MEQLPDRLAWAYLELLELDPAPGSVDGDALRSLQSAHLARVPYETVDIVRGRPPGIDPLDSVRRLLLGRGGYCFHLNGAFSSLLAWLGVDVARHVAGVQGREVDSPSLSGNHLGLTAGTADGRAWLVDVGLGDGPGEPLPLEAGLHEQGASRYRLRPSSLGNEAWRFDHDPHGGFLGFDLGPKVSSLETFAAEHERLSTDSGFARTVTVQRRTASRIEVLRGCVYTETTPDGVTATEIDDPAAWWDVVISHFGLAYGDVPAAERQALWEHTRAGHEVWKADLRD